MRLRTLTVSGLRPHFADAQTLDVSALVGPIVAVTGPNGAGKSVLLGAFPAALYREFPRGAGIDRLALGRTTYIRASIETAKGAFTITQHMDAQTGKGEATVRDAAGTDLNPTAKVTDFDRWAATNLPPASLLYASTFGAAKSVGLMDPGLAPQDRRLILFRALGLERWEPLPKLYEAKAEAVRRRRGEIEGQLAAERPRATVSTSDALLMAALAGLADCQKAFAEAEGALAAEKARHEALVAAYTNVQEARKRSAEALRRVESARGALRVVVDRQDAAESILRGEVDIRKAEADLAAVRAAKEPCVASQATAEANLTAAQDVALRATAALREAERAHAAAKATAERAKKAAADLPRAREAGVKAAAYQADITRLGDERDALVRQSVAVRERRYGVVERRLDAALGVLVDISEKDVPDPVADFPAMAREGLRIDEATAKAAEDAPIEEAELARKIEAVAEQLRPLPGLYHEWNALAARRMDLEAAAAEANRALDAELEAGRVLVDRQNDAKNAAAEVEIRRANIQRGREDIARLTADERRLAGIAARLPEIEGARARLEEIARARAAAETDLESAKEALRLCPEPPAEVPLPPDLSVLERAVAEKAQAIKGAEKTITGCEIALGQARAAAENVAALEAEAQRMDEEIADWTRLAADVRMMLDLAIDAAGPAIAETANALLHLPGCPRLHRYSVRVLTERPSADGKKMVADCFVEVTDRGNDFSGKPDGLSDGQLSVVGEAVRFALAHVACRNAGIERPTLVRDETAGALHEEMIPEYVALLRGACELLRADKVLIVTHAPSLAALADSVVTVENGKVTA